MNRRVLCLCGIAVLASAMACRGREAEPPRTGDRHVLIVSIDGLRPDLLMLAAAPHMHALMQNGSYTLRARTVEEGYTLPSHVSMLTGVTPRRHGVTWDNYIEDAYPSVPTLFEVGRRSGYTAAMIAGKTKFVVLTKPRILDWSYVGNEEREKDLDIARHAAAIVRDNRPDIVFVHLGQVDVVGHASGWASPEQMQAIEQADEAFGVIEDAIAAAGLTDSTLTILTADHGGVGLLHPPEDPLSQFIPWIVSGPSIRRNFDLTTLPDVKITTMATFATVCALLGIEPEQPLDTEPVLQILEPARN